MPLKVPSELKISDKWDKLLEDMVIKTGAGVTVGGLASIVLFRGSRGRIGMTMLAGGFGMGMAWERAAKQFEKN